MLLVDGFHHCLRVQATMGWTTAFCGSTTFWCHIVQCYRASRRWELLLTGLHCSDVTSRSYGSEAQGQCPAMVANPMLYIILLFSARRTSVQ